MSFTLTVKGAETLTYGQTMISAANVAIDTPNNSMARSTDMAITLHISGKLLATDKKEAGNSPTSKLFEWSKTPAINPDAYRDVTVNVFSEAAYGFAETPFRAIHLPNAFVVNYSERYSDLKGIGEFLLTLRQKADKVTDVKSNK